MAQPRTASDGRIQTSTQNNGAIQEKRKTLFQQVAEPSFLAELKRALPKHVTPDRMARIVLTALRTTRDLAHCTPESFFGCVMQAAQLGLEVNTPNGHAYLIPRRNKGVLECTIIVGYQGQIELALRSGKVEKIWARVVRQGDFFKVKYGLEEDIQHEPSEHPDRDKQPITYVYSVAKLKTGGTIFEVLSIAQVNERKRRSAAGDSGPWKSDPEPMTRKTAVRSLYKWLPKSSEMAMAEALDQRADEGRSQVFDETVNESIERLGMKPIVDTEGEPVGGEPSDAETQESTTHYDPETGEIPPREPGQEG